MVQYVQSIIITDDWWQNGTKLLEINPNWNGKVYINTWNIWFDNSVWTKTLWLTSSWEVITTEDKTLTESQVDVFVSNNWYTTWGNEFSTITDTYVANSYTPIDTNIAWMDFESNENKYARIKVANTNTIGNVAGALFVAKWSWADYTNNVYLWYYGDSFYLPYFQSKWVLYTDKSLIIWSNTPWESLDFAVWWYDITSREMSIKDDWIYIDTLKAASDHSTNNKFVYVDTDNWKLYATWYIETDPIWNLDKWNYYDKTGSHNIFLEQIVENILYSDLSMKIASWTLEVWKTYKITDFRTVYQQPISNVVLGWGVETLLVKAISNN